MLSTWHMLLSHAFMGEVFNREVLKERNICNRLIFDELLDFFLNFSE